MNLKKIVQGTIIKVDPNPIKGTEQGNYRPHVVISNNVYNSLSSLRILVPISQTGGFILDKKLTGTKTRGYVKCQHVRTLDLNARKYHIVETLDDDFIEEIKKFIYDNID